MKAKLDISHLAYSFEQEAVTAVLARAKIGALAVESVRLDRKFRAPQPCEFREERNGLNCRPALAPKDEWCERCIAQETMASDARKARRRLRDAVARYERECA